MKLVPYILFLIILACATLAASDIRLEGNVTVDWRNRWEFDVRVGDTTRTFDCEDVNASAYNDYDRTWVFTYYYNANTIQGCTVNEINNITSTVNNLLNHCQNYQTYLNDTTTYADRYAEWMASHARCSEKLQNEESLRKKAENDSATAQEQLDSCKRDKDTYMNDFKNADSRATTCSTDLKKSTDSFGSKYLIGAVIGGVAVYLFTKRKDNVAEESEEFDIVE